MTTAPNAMETIELSAKAFAGARDELASRLQALRDEIEAAKRRRLQGLKNSLERFRAAEGELRALVEGNRALFEQPKTRTFHGIRVGWMKQKGRVEIDDLEKVIELIRKKLPDLADVLIETSETVRKAAIADLTGAQIKAIGVTVTADSDAAFIKPVDDEVAKLLKALLADKDLEEIAP